MPRASEPRSEELFEIMRGSDPGAATRAFQAFLTTPGDWWNGDIPIDWARKVAQKYASQLAGKQWPVHKLGDSDWAANDALILLARLAPRIDLPPAFLRRVIQNTIQWEIVGHGRKGEPWAHDPEEVLEWKAAPSTGSASRRLWRSKSFCRSVAEAINSLSDTLRPYAILNLLDEMRSFEIARTLGVDEAKARQYLRRALQALTGRKDGPRLVGLESSRTIRRALSQPDGVFVDQWDAARAREREEAAQVKAEKKAKVLAKSRRAPGPRAV